LAVAESRWTGFVGHASRAFAAAVAACLLLSACWVVEVMNYSDDDDLDRYGIQARHLGTIWHIFTAPFLHASPDHIIGNSMPLTILAFLTALQGAARFLLVTLVVTVVSGLGVWFLADSGSLTLGASGLIFGYFGYLLARGVFERQPFDLTVAAIVAVLYGTIIVAAVPGHPNISWQAHLFGMLGGALAAFFMREGALSRAHSRRGPWRLWVSQGHS
jgi:membrane associated rhomboid family serine protease